VDRLRPHARKIAPLRSNDSLELTSGQRAYLVPVLRWPLAAQFKRYADTWFALGSDGPSSVRSYQHVSHGTVNQQSPQQGRLSFADCRCRARSSSSAGTGARDRNPRVLSAAAKR
jgi:hypothetical protein